MYEQNNFKHHYYGSLTSLSPYEFMIELGPLITECQIKKSQFYVVSPHLLRLGEGALQLSWYQSLGLGVSGKLLGLKCTYIVLCWPNSNVLILYIV